MSAAVTNSQSEREFASNYLALLSVSESKIVISPDYRKDLKDITTLGIKLPNLPNKKKAVNESNDASEKRVEASFKSIRPPRFNISFETAASNTIFEIKTTLTKHDELQGVSPSEIKLLVKGKVIQDSVLLNSITSGEDKVSFTVMINKDSSKSVSPAPTSEPDVSTIDSNTKIEPQTLPWDDIKKLLEQKGIDSTTVIDRLQKGWELTK